MRAVCCSVFLLLSLLILSHAKRQPAQDKRAKLRPPSPSPPPQPAKRPRNRSLLSSGELTTKDGHRCTWQTSGEGLVTLLVNCSAGAEADLERYWCRYAGKPERCQAYGVKSSQYWKQLVGKLKKRGNACGEKFLKAKTCKKAPPEAHMKLAQQSGGERRRGKEGGKKKGAAGGRREEGEKVQKRKEEDKKTEEEGGLEEERLMNDMAPAQSYCSEGWHAVCSFFLNFFDG